ncbi:MAG TPA: lipopolysaccharide heptosyltransferase I [Pyrinomonadaceae bacterium]|nr:lipopolysaccharide heptosyltransferase I [Pyrinomonadaceae bacterium]
MRILIVRLSAMGDLVQTLPALTDAAKAIPRIKFDWVVDESFVQVPSWHSHVENVFPTAMRRWGKNWVEAFQSGEPQALLKRLRATNYDLVIDLQGGFKSALASRLAKGPRAGHDSRGVHDWGAQIFYQKQFAVPKGMHSIQRMRRLLAAALGYPFPATAVDYGIVRQKLVLPRLALPQPYVVFIHSTSWASKIWPERYWQELLKRAVAGGFYVVLPWGDQAERLRSMAIRNGNERATVLPPLTISEKAAIIGEAQGTVGLDTGLSHIAAALDIPSVTIYGATDPRLVGATGKHQVHLASQFECIRCHQTECTYPRPAEFKPACLVELKPDDVWEKLLAAMLDGSSKT